MLFVAMVTYHHKLIVNFDVLTNVDVNVQLLDSGWEMVHETLVEKSKQNPQSLTFDIKGNAQYRFSSANNENTGHFDINVGWKNIAFLSSISFN